MLFVASGPPCATAAAGGVVAVALPLGADATGVPASNPPAMGGSSAMPLASGAAAMQLTADGSRLVVAGCDGCVTVFTVRTATGGVPVTDGVGRAPWDDDALVRACDYDGARAELGELHERLDELASRAEYSLRVRGLAQGEALRGLQEWCVDWGVDGGGGSAE
jgi:hypothetical protein